MASDRRAYDEAIKWAARVHELEVALDDALAWIVNRWEWDQEHYDELSAVREGHKDGLMGEAGTGVG